MSTFVIAYLIVWLGVVAYVVRLGVEQRRLSRRLDALRRQVDDSPGAATPVAEAA